MTVALDWDAWRHAYPTLTYYEQQAFHSAIYEQYPEQRHYDVGFVSRAIEETNAKVIVELGGWDGELAYLMLDKYRSIQLWTNVELCQEAAQAGLGRSSLERSTSRYKAPILDDWYWGQQWHADLFVASHVIEHLSLNHLNQTIEATEAQALFFDAPLLDKPLGWRGFTGTHILPTGWTGVTQTCQAHGYELTWAEDHETDPSSGGHARACLYNRQGGQ